MKKADTIISIAGLILFSTLITKAVAPNAIDDAPAAHLIVNMVRMLDKNLKDEEKKETKKLR
jgi:hypothetical protein